MLGIFDSGLGGLTVVRAIEKRLPGAAYIYLGDTARLPYGTKSPRTIERYALQALAFLREAGATAPIIACHTASSVLETSPTLRKTATALFNGVEPLDVIAPAIRAAKERSLGKRIGVIATPATIRSGIYQRALRNYRLVPVAAPVLVALAEEGWIPHRGRKVGSAALPILREALKPFSRLRIDTLILACTHFPVFEQAIRGILKPTVAIIDPGQELAAMLNDGSLSPPRGKRYFYATDIPEDFSERASRFLGRPVAAHVVTL